MIRPTDGGRTWSAPVDSPHGPIQLADGRILYAGKEFWTGAPTRAYREGLRVGKA